MNRFIALFLFSISVITTTACSQSNQNTEVSLDVEIGQMLKIGFRGLQVADTNHIVRDIKKYHLGGVVLFDYDVPRRSPVRNIASPGQVKKLVSDLKDLSDIPLSVAIDQEGGRVARLTPKHGFPKTVSAQYLGRLDNPDTTRYYVTQMAETLSQLGINVDLAPVVDINVNPDNPVIGSLGRSFSANPEVVTKQASIFIKTMHKYGILTVLKHFPGHGSSTQDSHLGVVDVSDTWSKKELIPYKQLMDSNLVDMVMTAHIFNTHIDSSYPATLSKPTITGILRDSLGFNGVVMSDDMMMGAIRKEYGLKTAIKEALDAGVDILSFANNSIYDPQIVPQAHDIIKKMVEDGEISRARIDSSYNRIMKLKKKLK
ncbi:MAG: glycoside hydrolase family 3 N-terminal domain-containing protein [Balneolaceae bacterium]|jgi:beta-N-acetylhexosaminidase